MTPLDALDAILSAVSAEYAADADVKVTAQPGQTTTQDWCWGGCGMVWVRLDTAFPSTAFPTPDQAPAACGAPLAARFHVGVARCVSGMDGGGNAPDPADQYADAALILTDAGRLRTALACATPAFSRKGLHLAEWRPMGPFGNCAGGYWTVTARLL